MKKKAIISVPSKRIVNASDIADGKERKRLLELADRVEHDPGSNQYLAVRALRLSRCDTQEERLAVARDIEADIAAVNACVVSMMEKLADVFPRTESGFYVTQPFGDVRADELSDEASGE